MGMRGNENFDGLPDQLIVRIAEDSLGLRARFDDSPILVAHKDGVGRDNRIAFQILRDHGSSVRPGVPLSLEARGYPSVL